MNDYLLTGEPMLAHDGNYRLIVIDKETKLPKVLNFGEIANWFTMKEVGDRLMSFTLRHTKDWKYPTEIHLKECLSSDGGRELFDVFDGDYLKRCSNVSDRIICYLRKYVCLPGMHDAELIACFVICSYFIDMFEYAPRLLIRGSSNTGKSTLLTILGELCYRGNQSGDTTEAALFRLIDSCQIMPILDEYQDYDPSAQNGIKKILKNGITRGHTVQRVEKIGNGPSEPRTYDVFGPVVFAYQSNGKAIPDEIINRSITITMISRKDVRIPMNQDREELAEIRNELFTLKWLWHAQPELVGYKKVYNEALQELQDPNGICTTFGTFRFSNRCRDILGTMYTVAKMTGTEEPILKFFSDMQGIIDDNDRDTEFGLVFMALMDVLNSRSERKIFGKDIIDLLSDITTYDIARRYEELMSREGEIVSTAKIPTRTVTNMLKDMGFSFVRDANTNRSKLSPSGLMNIFFLNVMKYGTEEQIAHYRQNDLTTNMSNKGENPVKGMTQINKTPNNLTRREG